MVQNGKRRLKQQGLVNWLAREGNSRAILTLLALGAAAGGVATFVLRDVLPLAEPTLATGAYADGYRAGYREAVLEMKNASLTLELEYARIGEQIRSEVENMSDAELNKALAEDLKNGTF